MALHTSNSHPNAFVRFMRKIYHPIGFKKGYNFLLFFIFAGALFGFLLARAPYMDVQNYYRTHAAPGEWFWYSQRFYNIGISLHLLCIIPAGFLAILQFTPIVRHKVRLFHRMNGYAVILLLTVANVGALMIARRAFGGGLSTQILVLVLAISTLGSAYLAYYKIKRLQIDQHRAWMLRCWFYAGSIITLRLIMVLTALAISSDSSYNAIIPCQQIAFTNGNRDGFPACVADPNGNAIVHANLATANSAAEAAAAFHISFGGAGWLAVLLHAVGVELYLRLTPIETERLRQVSYERQLEHGIKRPRSPGLTVEKLGDAEEWKPSPNTAQKNSGKDERKRGIPVVDRRDESKSETVKPKSVLGWH